MLQVRPLSGVLKHLGVAQLGARRFRVAQVAGSNPVTQINLAPVAQSARGALFRAKRMLVRVQSGVLVRCG